MSDLKNRLRRHPHLYSFLLFFRSREERVEFILRRLTHWPKLHCMYLVKKSILYGYGRTYPRTLIINLDKPEFFNEKLLWLKYYRYNKDLLVIQCYDKYLVREYVKQRGCGEILNELYGVWDSVDEIPWDNLPDEFIIKKTNGSGNHVFKRKGQSFDIEAAKRLLKFSNYREHLGNITSGDLFAVANQQRYICERLLKPEKESEEVDDYKFYCFHGVPKYLLFIWDRVDKTEYNVAFKEIDLDNDGALIDRSEYRNDAQPLEIQMPGCYQEMLDCCRKLAAPFPFVRVDFYVENGRPIFGELTFTPAGSHMLPHVFKTDNSINSEGLLKLGSLIDLSK